MSQDSTSLKTVFSIFEESAGAGIIDVLQMMSRKGYLREAYDEKAGKFVIARGCPRGRPYSCRARLCLRMKMLKDSLGHLAAASSTFT